MGEAKRRKNLLGDKYWAGNTEWSEAKRAAKRAALSSGKKLPDLGEAVFNQVGDCPVHYGFYTSRNKILVNQASDISTVTLIPTDLHLTQSSNGDRLPIIFGAHILNIECPASFMTAHQLADTVLSADGVDLVANNASRFVASNGDVVVPFNLADCPTIVHELARAPQERTA